MMADNTWIAFDVDLGRDPRGATTGEGRPFLKIITPILSCFF